MTLVRLPRNSRPDALITVRPNDVGVKMDRLFVITKHALGRRYQRGWPVHGSRTVFDDVLDNMDFPTQEARDMVPDLFAETLKRNLRLVDEHDRAIGSRA